MRPTIFILTLLSFLLVQIPAWSVDQRTFEKLVDCLYDFEENIWPLGVFDDQTLEEGLPEVYGYAIEEGKHALEVRSLWAMGQTGLIAFEPILLDAMEEHPTICCGALSNIPSEDSLRAIIAKLNDEDLLVRIAAVKALQVVPYYAEFPEAAQEALGMLNVRKNEETYEDLLIDISEAIDLIEKTISAE
ncbi:MAG TPA: HEAT repeat domain-containing protein [Candidatus Hodarchaeales archaeon]|nr:HEAT repeat domain-containing protein [Candidatus Hodarchaeales archaeon]